VMGAVSEKEPLLRAHQLYDAIGKLSSAELAALFEKAVKVDDPDRREALISALLTRWMLVDPEAARIAVRPYVDRFRSAFQVNWRSVDAIVNQTLAQILPDETLAAVMTDPDAPWSRHVASTALASLSGQRTALRAGADRNQIPGGKGRARSSDFSQSVA
jgi:hypothetical protein